MHLATYLGLLETGCHTLAGSYRQVADGHAAEVDVFHVCHRFARECDQHGETLTPFTHGYGSHPAGEPERLHAQGLKETRSGGLGLLRDLHDLHLLATYLNQAWTMVDQAGQGARDHDLISAVRQCASQTSHQLSWLTTRMKAAAPQALLVAD